MPPVFIHAAEQAAFADRVQYVGSYCFVGWLPTGQVVLCYGQGGKGKSWVMAGIMSGLSCAAGEGCKPLGIEKPEGYVPVTGIYVECEKDGILAARLKQYLGMNGMNWTIWNAKTLKRQVQFDKWFFDLLKTSANEWGTLVVMWSEERRESICAMRPSQLLGMYLQWLGRLGACWE